MPTPFMHLAFAERVIADPALPDAMRTLLTAPDSWGAFLLGNIAPDARVSSGMRRADTHFFEYVPTIAVPPITEMLTRFPALNRDQLHDNARIAFVAGYGAHLAMDEIWCTDLLFPHFMNGWEDKTLSFHMLHMLLASIDARDYQALPRVSQYPALATAQLHDWLPFMADNALIEWRDLIADQIAPEGTSSTVTILSQRIAMMPETMAAFIADPMQMADSLWRQVPPEVVASVEQAMYDRARGVLLTYLAV